MQVFNKYYYSTWHVNKCLVQNSMLIWRSTEPNGHVNQAPYWYLMIKWRHIGKYPRATKVAINRHFEEFLASNSVWNNVSLYPSCTLYFKKCSCIFRSHKSGLRERRWRRWRHLSRSRVQQRKWHELWGVWRGNWFTNTGVKKVY
jgi:hypothetical protein